MASKETGLEVNADKNKYMVMSRDQNARQSYSMMVDNISVERVEEFKYLGTTLTIQNSFQKEDKRKLKLGKACYHSVQYIKSFSLLFKNLKIKIYRNTILSAVLYGCETKSLTLRGERTLSVFQNRVLRRLFRQKMDEITESRENFIMRSLMISNRHPILFGL